MSKAPNRLSGLKATVAAERIPPAAKVKKLTVDEKKARIGKKAIVGYFSRELSNEIRRIGIDEGLTIQEMLGEALDLFLESRNRARFNERANSSEEE